MDANQLNELATNAELNHWPPHIGVTTDAEKIEYLAQRLREAADAETRADELTDQLETALENEGTLEDEVSDLRKDLATLRSENIQLKAKLEAEDRT